MNDTITNYVSCACNRVPHSADWGKNGLICFAACHAIVIYDPRISKIGRITNTLHKHKDRINTVRWIKRRNSQPELELLSSSVDGTALLWRKKRHWYDCVSIIEAGDNLTFSNALYLSDDYFQNNETFSKLLICTGSVEGELRIWLRDASNNVECLQMITFGKKLPIEASFTFLPYSNIPLLAVAIENSTIELYVTNSNIIEEPNFIKVQVLVGHEDWVRCMDFNCDTNDILLASGSQDAMIRLWKISVKHTDTVNNELSLKEQVFIVNDTKYNITLESVLCGHEGWIYGIHWYPLQSDNHKILRLLSCSLDKSMIIWEPDKVTGIWSEKVRVGEVGGNSMGFYGCKFSGDGLSMLAHGYQGSFHIWEYSYAAKNWIPKSVPSGHFAEVVDLCWDPNGRFLITASIDQTVRIHAPWKNGATEYWHEIGRPQVHGYDMSCLVMLTPYMYASGAEEKVVRIFTAPATFKNSLMKIANVDDFKDIVADSASVPALGLTNKATLKSNIEIETTNSNKNEDYISPTEEELMQNTLWPELQKLYGHGYEIFSIAAKYDGSLLATACKSTSPEHSAILLYDTKTWIQVQKLMSHQLTVTQMEFSPNDKYLISVSRDRRWSLFECQDNVCTLIAASSKKESFHTRIIWCCSWTNDSSFFATGSRDGNIGVWNPEFTDYKIVPTARLDTKTSVTALTFLLQYISEHVYLLAVGFETGCIEIQNLRLHSSRIGWERYMVLDSTQAHHLTVKRLKFRPKTEYSNILQLASCGSDHTVKIYDIDISDIFLDN